MQVSHDIISRKGKASKQWHATCAIVSIPWCSVDAVVPPGPGAMVPPGVSGGRSPLGVVQQFPLVRSVALVASVGCRDGGRCREPPRINCANHCPVIIQAI